MEKSKKEKGKPTEVKPAAAKPATIAPAKAENQAPAAQAAITAPQTQSLKDHCSAHIHRYVLAQTHDGWCIDGIVEYVDDRYLCLAVPCSGTISWDNRAFVSYPGLYPYPYYPRGRFYRQVLPLAGLLALTLLPFY
ncbi:MULTISPECIES: hypothetical protein [unclassified Paenibacillus]|uniref:hypothetical protein n=1 Tax=unclassified Paenibacillus TaxID=185978 RepID=UPI0010E58758|nr:MULTISPECIES: hypothetical protein [unclassified Paenibacillus]NIK67525.1 hypothetical protein [Paenibacillus sp. BK720]TCN01568.1 hypothetical protein EV294_1011025 [Paenibacillus sp. BK033]